MLIIIKINVILNILSIDQRKEHSYDSRIRVSQRLLGAPGKHARVDLAAGTAVYVQQHAGRVGGGVAREIEAGAENLLWLSHSPERIGIHRCALEGRGHAPAAAGTRVLDVRAPSEASQRHRGVGYRREVYVCADQGPPARVIAHRVDRVDCHHPVLGEIDNGK